MAWRKTACLRDTRFARANAQSQVLSTKASVPILSMRRASGHGALLVLQNCARNLE